MKKENELSQQDIAELAVFFDLLAKFDREQKKDRKK